MSARRRDRRPPCGLDRRAPARGRAAPSATRSPRELLALYGALLDVAGARVPERARADRPRADEPAAYVGAIASCPRGRGDRHGAGRRALARRSRDRSRRAIGERWPRWLAGEAQDAGRRVPGARGHGRRCWKRWASGRRGVRAAARRRAAAARAAAGRPQVSYFTDCGRGPGHAGRACLLCCPLRHDWIYPRMTCAGVRRDESTAASCADLRRDAGAASRTCASTRARRCQPLPDRRSIWTRDRGARCPIVDELAALPLDLYAAEQRLRRKIVAEPHGDLMEAHDERPDGRLLHRHDALHRLQGLRGGVQGVEPAPRGTRRVPGDSYDNTGQLDEQNWRHVQFIDKSPTRR